MKKTTLARMAKRALTRESRRPLSLVLAYFLALIFVQTSYSFACGPTGGFLPENKLKIPVGQGNALLDTAMTEAAFLAIIDKAERIYAPLISAKGGTLQVVHDWRDATVNAYADRQGSTWLVKMYGGLARHPAITADGFALVLCHEFGHHLGGVPRYAGQWAANEGQADYFSTLKCLRRVWLNDDNRSITKALKVPREVTEACEKSFSDANAIAICQRTAMAGLSSGQLSAALDGSRTVDFTTPDPAKVNRTADTHPKAQCRLDTYYQGSLCQVGYEDEIGQTDPTVGVCSMEKNDAFGYRPQCWYKPGTDPENPQPPSPAPGGDIAPQPLLNGQTDLQLSNPNTPITIEYDVSALSGATGAYVEIVGPNRDFSEPNGTKPDSARILWGANRGIRGRLITQRPLSFGTFKARAIGLGGNNGEFPVGRFSNPSTIRVR